MAGDDILFYFDFSSPYGYLAAQRIEALAKAHGRGVDWRPHLLGAAFKISGARPLLDTPLKGDYARHDLRRSARRIGAPFILPRPFPFAAVAASRAYYWLCDRDRSLAARFVKAAYHAAFGEGRDISGAAAVVDVAAGLGVDAGALGAALSDPALKARLRDEVQAAIDAGVFGSPYMVVDGEPYWGFDRLPDIAAQLAAETD